MLGFLLLSFFLLASQVVGVLYLSTVNLASLSLPSGRESMSHSLIIPVLFVVVVNLYLVFLRSQISLKILRYYVLVVGIISWWLVLASVMVRLYIGMLSDAVFMAFAIAIPLMLRTNFKRIAENLMALSLSSLAGATLALMLGVKPLLATLAILSILDYHFVLRNRKILEVAEKFQQAKIPLGVSVDIGDRRLTLGYGDMIFSTAVVCSAYIEYGILGIMPGILSAIALFVFLIKYSRKKALPALPPIFIGSLLGVAVIKVLEYQMSI